MPAFDDFIMIFEWDQDDSYLVPARASPHSLARKVLTKCSPHPKIQKNTTIVSHFAAGKIHPPVVLTAVDAIAPGLEGF